ncbi:MAG: uncharacterized protein QOC99_2238 [Acidobacteriota bacterium]|jgi:uncharacterized protein (TIGR00251 family)|nr:uncharacterized protein [Acidobacteriota bacterium]MDT7779726.1 uncharacterized protein [Acidobacteriota bacterium]
MINFREEEGALVFVVRVVPRASKSAVVGEYDGALKVRVGAPPVEGAANEELTRLLAGELGVPARSVEIVSGHTSKTKTVRAHGVRASQLLRLANEQSRER